MSSLVPETNWVQGASGPANMYDTSPSGLGMNPTYLASANASATSSTTTSGTIFPTSPSDGNIFIYTADAVNAVKWAFVYDSSQTTYKWVFVGGPPMRAITLADETTTTNATWLNLTTNPGPGIASPRAGDYYVRGGAIAAAQGGSVFMNFGVAAGDTTPAIYARSFNGGGGVQSTLTIADLLTGVSAGTSLKTRYRIDTSGGTGGDFFNRWIEILPDRVI